MELGDCASWTGAIASVIACIVSIQAATKARRDLKDSSKIQIIQKRLDEVKKVYLEITEILEYLRAKEFSPKYVITSAYCKYQLIFNKFKTIQHYFPDNVVEDARRMQESLSSLASRAQDNLMKKKVSLSPTSLGQEAVNILPLKIVHEHTEQLERDLKNYIIESEKKLNSLVN